MLVASAYQDRAPRILRISSAQPRKWVKRAGALAGVAVGAGAFFAAQASSFEILAPTFSVTATVVPEDDGGSDSRSGAAEARSPSASDDGPTAAHAGVRARSAAASDSLPADLRAGVITLANATQANFADAPELDASMLSAASARSEGEGASQSAESFPGGAPAGFLGAGGAGGGGGGGLAGAASGLPGTQSAASAGDGQPDGAINGLQPLQSAVTSVAGVPEPATWTTLILGFGLLGATLRRRRGAFVRT